MNAHHAYNYTYLPPLAFIDRVPGLGFTLGWALRVLAQLLRVIINDLAARLDAELGHLDTQVDASQTDIDNGRHLQAGIKLAAVLGELVRHDGKLADIHVDLRSLIADTAHLEQGAMRIIQRLCARLHETGDGRISSLAEYNAMFRTIALPAIAGSFEQDASFAEMRVAGPNPMVLSRLTAPLEKFPLSNAMYQAVMGSSDDLDSAIDQGRVYVADYALLNGALAGSYPEQQKYMAAPIALFAVPASGPAPRRLVPVAIQCQQQPGPGNPVVQPPLDASDRQAALNWTQAKTVVQTADGNYHEAISHLGQTHLVLEPFVVATLNTLDEQHPVARLLTPHFEGTLLINNLAQSSLIASGGTVDAIMQGSIDQDRVLAVLGTQAILHDFNRQGPIESLSARGVDDAQALPWYPYRDAALAVFEAISDWVQGYVAAYYPNDSHAAGDASLQAWIAELLSHQGGRLHNVGEQGGIRTSGYLSALLAKVIFIASAQHAAVNFPQKAIMSYTPAMPLAGYASPPDGRELNEADWFTLLPPRSATRSQLNVGQLLGGVYYTQLGQYPSGHFSDARVQALLTQFQQRLAALDVELANKFPDYPFLRPSQVPQSINI